MSVIDLKQAIEQKTWQTNKVYQDIRKSLKDQSYMLKLTGEEAFALKLGLAFIIESNLVDNDTISFAGQMFLNTLQNVFDKIDDDISVE